MIKKQPKHQTGFIFMKINDISLDYLFPIASNIKELKKIKITFARKDEQ